MKPISMHVNEEEYQDFKSLAERTGRPVAELIREAMTEYLARHGGRSGSIFDVPAHHGGAQLKAWTRDGILDEMIRK